MQLLLLLLDIVSGTSLYIPLMCTNTAQILHKYCAYEKYKYTNLILHRYHTVHIVCNIIPFNMTFIAITYRYLNSIHYFKVNYILYQLNENSFFF